MRKLRPVSSLHSQQGSVLILSVIILSSMMVILMGSLGRSVTSSRVSKNSRTAEEENVLRRSILNMAILQAKNYAWESGHNVGQLLPTNSDRFKQWYSNVYDGISYSVSVGDNSDETGTQDYKSDKDNKVYLRVSVQYPSGTRTTQVLMSPGAAATSGEPPAGFPSGVGICYGVLNLITLMSMNASSIASGYDTTPFGYAGCTDSAGCDGAYDQLGVTTTSWFGSWALGTYFDLGSYSHAGQVIGVAGPDGDPTKSYGRPTTDDCTRYGQVLTLARTLRDASSPSVVKYAKTFGTMTVAGNLTIGTEATPKILYLQTGILGKVTFSGTISGVGIMIVDGNVDFAKPVNWTGILLNNANTLVGNVANFKDDVTVYGAASIYKPFLTAEVGSISGDIKTTTTDPGKFIYSSNAINGVLDSLDSSYVPPSTGAPGQLLTVSSIQDI